MARPKKSDVEKPKEGATLQIDVESFVRTRDSVVTGLATLQDAIQTLSSAYIKHTNAVLGEHGAGLDVESPFARLNENPLLGGLPGLRGITPMQPAVDAKKEKKKRVHDPNAPKRPLTPYFLYMQTARPIIRADLGEDVPKGAVSTEGVHRWKEMADADKQLWANAYNDNLKLYNARMHAYKAGNITAKDMSDEQAALYAETHQLSTLPIEVLAHEQLAADSLLDLPAADEASLPSTPETSPPPKTTPKARAKPKKGKQTPVATPVVEQPQAPIVPPSSTKATSPDKKRKRAGKKGDEVVTSIEKEDETPKGSKGRKKKSRSD